MTGAAAPSAKEVLRFENLEPYLLLKNGNYLYKVPFRGGWAVLKTYYDSHGFWGRVKKTISNVLYSGQTSYMPRTRCRIERECLALWGRHGFRVFDAYDGVEVEAPGCRPGAYRLLEYVQATKLLHHLKDESLPLDARFATYRRFLKEWSRRHDLAIQLREPRLVHENGDMNHVMLVGDGFLWFDFEMVYRFPSSVAGNVSHEIVQYIWDAHKQIPEGMRARFLDETIAGYPARERLRGAYDYFHLHPNPLIRWARWMDRRFSKRAQKPTSKYNVVRELRERLERI